MIRAQAIADHEKTTGHNGFRGATDETGRVVCTQCPWQYPPAAAPEPVTDAETNPIGRYVRMVGGPRDGHMIHVESWTISVAYPIKRLDGSAVTLTMPIELDVDSTPPREVIRWSGPVDDIPTDPEPAMGPTDDETSDPGPVPEDPPTEPPLDLKARIANLIDVYFGMQDGNPGLPNTAAAADLTDAIHRVVAAGADFTKPEENTELTPAQGIAYLLDLPEWARVARLGMLLEQARKGSDCFMRGHQDIEQELRGMRQQRDRLHHAMVQIARLTATVDQPESVGQSVIGSISSEALVPE